MIEMKDVRKLSLTPQDVLVIRCDDWDSEVVANIRKHLAERGVTCAAILGVGVEDDVAVVATDAQAVARAAEHLVAGLCTRLVKALRKTAVPVDHALMILADLLETEAVVLTDPMVAGLAKAADVADDDYLAQVKRETAAERALAPKPEAG